ncbi:MAG: GNAT family N-acetyltransferase, partial [Gammaproteobacteria bacterium]|nr:GNAT family N-acetyltransferase [Gammaproteobacteria bacterium]
MSNEYSIKQLSCIQEVSAIDWNTIANTSNPFVSHEYLSGLERFDCLDNHGWIPCHIVAYSGDVLVGGIPLYIRSNSYGEFVFDWAWADAYERAGGSYYPKLVSAIPFAPVSGPRILAHPDNPHANSIRLLLLKHVIQLIKINNLSSYHCLFPDDSENIFTENKLLQRHTVQFHWQNKNYTDFREFASQLTSKKRKQILRERKKVFDNGIVVDIFRGDQMNEELWSSYYEFYCSTFYRRWGNPRLTKEFFYSLSVNLPEQTLVFMASAGSKYIAGAFLMLGNQTLYGRHWGCIEQHPYLHFELCYYQAIDYAIAYG